MPKQYSARQIAKYFLAKTDEDVGELISNLKLQKLCYYAQGVGVAARGEPLFQEGLEAWLHGPVVPDLYRDYRDYGRGAIPPVTDLNLGEYDEADRLILDDVFDYFGQYSAWRLRQMTHAESPWRDAYIEGENRPITIDALRNFFKDQIEEEYRRKYAQLQRRAA